MRALIAIVLITGVTSVWSAVIDTSVGRYLVERIDTSFDAEETLLRDQIWWQDQALAEEFATLVNTQLGANVAQSQVGPFFAFEPGVGVAPRTNSVAWFSGGSSLMFFEPFQISTRTYAFASPVATPGSLILILIGAGVLIVRQRLGLLVLRRPMKPFVAEQGKQE